jgi:hypothetical protein
MAKPRYGKINFEMMSNWIGRAPNEDGPFWALNLMKYREVAAYTDGRETTRSGRDADDEYVPRKSLEAIGAKIVLGADVSEQRGSEPIWDRVGIVRYPTRLAFLQMQQRDDFKEKHVHKDAGMECTIVMSCLPVDGSEPVPTGDATMVLRVARGGDGFTLPTIAGATRLATFDVEGVIVGDDRTWTTVAFDAVSDRATIDALLDANGGAEECVAIVLGAPALDALASSLER